MIAAIIRVHFDLPFAVVLFWLYDILCSKLRYDIKTAYHKFHTYLDVNLKSDKEV